MRPKDLRISGADPSQALKLLGWKAQVDIPLVVVKMLACDLQGFSEWRVG